MIVAERDGFNHFFRQDGLGRQTRRFFSRSDIMLNVVHFDIDSLRFSLCVSPSLHLSPSLPPSHAVPIFLPLFLPVSLPLFPLSLSSLPLPLSLPASLISLLSLLSLLSLPLSFLPFLLLLPLPHSHSLLPFLPPSCLPSSQLLHCIRKRNISLNNAYSLFNNSCDVTNMILFY